MRHGFSREGVNESVRAFSIGVILRVAQPTLKVPKRIEIGHELDVVSLAVRLQLEYVTCGQGGSIAPHRLMIGEGKRVLGVQLQLVKFQVSKLLYQCF